MADVLVLVDADNVSSRRAQPVLDLLDEIAPEAQVVGSGRAEALARLRWPAAARLLPQAGWQQADIALAGAYVASAAPLVLITGDGDFGLLATRHPGPVLVISGAASNRLREGTTVVDPATDGTRPVRQWLTAHQPF